MDKNLSWKIIAIVFFAVLAGWTLYPAGKTLKPGIDLAGGTSLIYEIDTVGLTSDDKKGLSGKMITILRRRIDPANIQNLIWRPQGNSRFEIQMPLASPQARLKRQDYERALQQLRQENINPAVIMRALLKPADQRAQDFQRFAADSNDRMVILNDLALAYDQRKELQDKRDNLSAQLKTAEDSISAANIDLLEVQANVNTWASLDDQKLAQSITNFLSTQNADQKNLPVLTDYASTFGQWAEVVEQLTEPETGKNDQYKKARKAIDKLSLTEEQINICLEMDPKSAKRVEIIAQLKTDFADRAEKIDNVIVAFDEYRLFRGGLDDPKDLQRMLKGAGILEFRILPTADRTELSADEVAIYIERLKTKGPKFASDTKYIWAEVENAERWENRIDVFTQSFGNKLYVLASNNKNEIMVHTTDETDWKLKKATPDRDRMGRRAIAFSLDERGGKIFWRITGNNLERPLCILLDGIAISAPNIQSRITSSGIITGSFTQKEVEDMVNKLNAGSLPARLIEQPISVKTIGPSIGAENRDKGVRAGIIGFAMVVLCMAIYYTLAGAIADVALFLNLLFILAIMAFSRATFTLPGIAGLILTIGMSVDANVLIFERIREEQQRGSSLRIAIKNGYQRAFRTIIDANITTFMTAAILFWVASEEIKGFAIVLMIGIASSMVTALFVTRVIFDFLLSKGIIKDHLVMRRIVKKPNINWMGLRPVFFAISSILVVGGLIIFFTRDPEVNNKYDIEFTGGTSVQINLKENVSLTRQQVVDRFQAIAEEMDNPALAAANVYSVGETGKQYEITTTETNKTSAILTFPAGETQTAENIKKAVADQLTGFSATQNDTDGSFTITTSQTNKSLVKSVLSTAFKNVQISEPQVDEVVNRAIIEAFGDDLQILQNLQPKITSDEIITEEIIDAYPELIDYLGGLKLTCKLQKSTTGKELQARFEDLRFKPDMRHLNWYTYSILNLDLTEIDSDQQLDSFIFVTVHPEAGSRDLTDNEWERLKQNEINKIEAAASLETSLPRVTQISPSIGAEAKTQALIAIVLSLFAIITYIWVRFGDVRYGLAAIIALLHDVCITLGAVTFCTYIASTSLGEKLLIGDFKINLAMIAAFLTLIGYSLNDTIVVFDRIRENRKKAQLNSRTITDSINQTISRTLMTSFTTFIVVLIMYIFGGPALRGFTFAIGFGIIIGTYSSIAIAAPILLIGSKLKDKK